MRRQAILDTGPIVALLNKNDHFHVWATGEFGRLAPPALTCEAVLTEAWHLLRRLPAGQLGLLQLLSRGLIEVRFSLIAECSAVIKLATRYANVPMSLADACLVRMAEIHTGSPVVTLDRDFSVYRVHGRQVIPLIMAADV